MNNAPFTYEITILMNFPFSHFVYRFFSLRSCHRRSRADRQGGSEVVRDFRLSSPFRVLHRDQCMFHNMLCEMYACATLIEIAVKNVQNSYVYKMKSERQSPFDLIEFLICKWNGILSILQSRRCRMNFTERTHF